MRLWVSRRTRAVWSWTWTLPGAVLQSQSHCTTSASSRAIRCNQHRAPLCKRWALTFLPLDHLQHHHADAAAGWKKNAKIWPGHLVTLVAVTCCNDVHNTSQTWNKAPECKPWKRESCKPDCELKLCRMLFKYITPSRPFLSSTLERQGTTSASTASAALLWVYCAGKS